ncbi:MAG: YiiX/YebB-like N1pC/P60 family cysteine hydrolase [Candidatus Gracilibacteria bacterium]|nr:YiiX/YebB-like N1pC/P60 family cysteine hydrolase [Candidatus Gracilibacteria bacterium]
MSGPQNNIVTLYGEMPDVPKTVKIGDFVVARYKSSEWARYLPWEAFDHAALVTQLNPLKIIEVSGILLQKGDKKNNKVEVREGVVEYEFNKSRTVTLLDGTKNLNANLWILDELLEVRWLKPNFPNPIREIDKWYIPRSKRKIITEQEARKRAVKYARNQMGEPYSIFASKWSENKWYCSLLIYKSYSRTVTGMYLETYGRSFDLHAGPLVTPEDLADSPQSKVYAIWKKENQGIKNIKSE